MRAAAPAADDTSLHTSESCPSALAREHRVEHELRQRAAGHAPGQDVLRAKPQDADDAGEREEDGDDGEQRARARGAARRLVGVLHRAAEAPDGGGLRVERLHGPHRAEILRREGGGFRQRVLRAARTLAHRAARGDERQHDHGNGDQHEPRQLGARVDHHGDGAGEHENIAQQHRGRGAERRLHLRRVGGEAGHEFADAGLVVEIGVEVDEMGEHVAAQVRHHPLADRHDEVVAEAGRQGEDRHHQHHRAEIAVDGPHVVGGKAVVDHSRARRSAPSGSRRRPRSARAWPRPPCPCGEAHRAPAAAGP